MSSIVVALLILPILMFKKMDLMLDLLKVQIFLDNIKNLLKNQMQVIILMMKYVLLKKYSSIRSFKI